MNPLLVVTYLYKVSRKSSPALNSLESLRGLFWYGLVWPGCIIKHAPPFPFPLAIRRVRANCWNTKENYTRNS